jgi:hypothetical protein
MAKSKKLSQNQHQDEQTQERQNVQQVDGTILQFNGRVFSGKLERQNEAWSNAKSLITERSTTFFLAKMNGRTALSESNIQMSDEESYYKAKFRQGADLMPRKFFFVNISQKGKSALSASSNQAMDAKPPYKEINIEGLVDKECLFKSIISQNILPFCIDNPLTIHLPLILEDNEWQIVSPQKLAAKDLGNSSKFFKKCADEYTAKTNFEGSRLFDGLNYNNKLLVQKPDTRLWVLFNAAGSNVSAAVYNNSHLFWADQQTYWYCPKSKSEAYYLSGILNAPCMNILIKPFQSRGLAGERHIHKKILELVPKFDTSNENMKLIADIAADAETQIDNFLSQISGRGISSKRKLVRQKLSDTLKSIDEAVKSIVDIKE